MRKILIILFALLFIQPDGFAQKKASDYLRAALVSTNNKNYTQAILLCDAAINLNNAYESAYFHRGYNKFLMKDYAGALIDFGVVIDLNSENLDAYLYRALSNQKSGNKWAATQDYNSARRIDSVETLAFIAANIFR